MKIDWFTLIAQVINFLVLMWLLKRYLYKPILKAINQRESKIIAELNDAKAKKQEAEKEREEFNRKNEAFDRKKEELMQKAIAETDEKKQKMKEAVRKEVNTLKEKLEKGVNDEHESRNKEIARKIQEEVLDISRKALADLADAGLEEQSVRTFIKKINGLKKNEKKKFVETLTSGNDPVLVKSAFNLSAHQQTEIKKAVDELSGRKNEFDFKSEPELINGIELSANGYKLAWSISEYLNSLGEDFYAKSLEETKEHSDKK
ncbi:MAG: F0F1 ATP synthase subunit B [Cyclobacteriaceae bacterium]